MRFLRLLSLPFLLALALSLPFPARAQAQGVAVAPAQAFPGLVGDFHGYVSHSFAIDGCAAIVVEPKNSLPGRPWAWRMLFWGVYPAADIAFLNAGMTVAYIGVGNTFGCPDAMKHFDAFYTAMTGTYGLAAKPALEGLSRGGLYAYRWAYVNTDKVGCIYGDAPVCDMKSWPGGKGHGKGSPSDWQLAIKAYHFASEQQMIDFKGNPVDNLAPLAAAKIPIIHVCGDADTTVPETENTDIVRERYLKMGGTFALIVKEGCGHHPHGLVDPTLVVDFVLASCCPHDVSPAIVAAAPKSGVIIRLPKGKY